MPSLPTYKHMVGVWYYVILFRRKLTESSAEVMQASTEIMGASMISAGIFTVDSSVNVSTETYVEYSSQATTDAPRKGVGAPTAAFVKVVEALTGAA